MTEEQLERARRNQRLLKEKCPDGLPFVRALFEVCLIEGWRAIVKVTPRKDPENERQPPAAHL